MAVSLLKARGLNFQAVSSDLTSKGSIVPSESVSLASAMLGVTPIPASGKRKQERYLLELDVRLYLALEDNTSERAISLSGCTKDVSFKGMRTFLRDVPCEVCGAYLRRLRFARHLSRPQIGGS